MLFSLLSILGLPPYMISIDRLDTPSKVADKFSRLYPHAYNATWYLFKGIYDVRFYQDGELTNTYFNRHGEVIKEFRSVSIEKLPQSIMNNMIEGLKGYQIANILWDEFHASPHYKITFKKNKKIIEAEYDQQGHVLSNHVM